MAMLSIFKFSKLSLAQRIFIALILGSLAGLLFGDKINFLAPVGKMFISAISMLVVPLVFVSIVTAVLSISDFSTMRRLTIKSLVLYIGTMAIATVIGISFALLFKPGLGLPPELVSSSLAGNEIMSEIIAQGKQTSLMDTITTIIPSNVIRAFANGDILPTIFFALVLGIALVAIKERAKPLSDLLQSSMAALFKAVDMVLAFAPIGVFCLISQIVSSVGIGILKELSLLIITIWVGCVANAILVYVPLLLASRLNPLTFFKKMLPPMSIALSTCSSAATLPLNLETVHQRIGVSAPITNFVLPLGATINMNGASVYLGVSALFVANIFGVDLSLWQYVLIVLTSTLASIGCAGVPMTAIIMMTMVLSAAGLPIEAIALIASVDRIIDMGPTTLNITGDAVTAVVVAKSENALDEKIYNDMN